jgi:hypothetical protein
MSTAAKGAVGVAALAAAGVAGYLVFGGSEYGSTAEVAPSSAPSPTTAGAATATPVTVGSRHLEPGPADVVATDPSPATGGSQVTVVLSYLGWNDQAPGGVEASGYARGVVEDGGACTLTLTLGTATVSAHAVAEADASTTTCGGLLVPGSSLTPGKWQATLTYASARARGSSDTATVEVPAR